jgi:hypothetical protein
MSLSATNLFAKIDRVCGTNSTSYPLADKAIDINLALDDVFAIALKARGWNVDDLNHTKDPFITQNIVSGQRNYYFTRDEQSNLILAFRKIMVKDSSGVFQELDPVDQQSDSDMNSFWDGQNAAGQPTRYDKTGNGIFLDPVPNYNATGGLKAFIDREASYFVAGDTTKVAGIDGLCQDYLYLKPSYEYCRDHDKKNTEKVYRDLQTSIQKIKDRYGSRETDVKRRMSPRIENCR